MLCYVKCYVTVWMGMD